MHRKSKRIQIGNRVSIRPRGKKKTYTAEFWHDGQHRRKSLETRNMKVARQRAAALELELESGRFRSAPPPMTIDEAVERYLSYLETEDRRRKTTVRYRGILGTFVEFAQMRHVNRLAQVTTAHIDEYRAQRKLTHARKTMRNEGTLLKSFFRWCVSRGFVRSNPLASMTFPRPVMEPRGGPSLEEINRILDAAPEPRRLQFAVLAFTGMRSGELQRLRREDIDFKGNWINVVSRNGARTKTGRSRKVPIHPRLQRMLNGRQPRKGAWYFEEPPSRKYPNGGHHISTKRLNEAFLATLKKLKLPAGREAGFTVHSLRHSFETICINANLPQRAVDTWLGHASDRSMASVYYRLSDADSQRFMASVPFGDAEPMPNDSEEEQR